MTESLTSLINRARGGDEGAADALYEQIQSELHRVASAQMGKERAGHTLQATALVHEAYIRLSGSETMIFEDRAHFMRTMARAMRRLLVDHARKRGRQKRGGHAKADRRVPLDEIVETCSVDLISLNDALEVLAKLSPRQALLVELRFFGGMTAQEAADLLGISKRTADGDWGMARAWLASRLRG